MKANEDIFQNIVKKVFKNYERNKSLIFHPGMVRPDIGGHDDIFMNHTY